MKTLLTILTYILLTNPTLCQDDKQYNLQEYNAIKYKAENHILENNFNLAANYYDSLSAQHQIFNIDLNNYFLVALSLNDTNRIEYCTKLSIQRGVNMDYLPIKYNFNYFDSDHWQNLKTRNYIITVDSSMRRRVQLMYTRDQENRSIDSLMLRNDFENMILFNSLYEKGETPTEIGLGLKANGDSDDFVQMYEILLTHLCKLYPYEMKTTIENLYRNGDLSVSIFLYLLSFTESCDDIQLACFPNPPANVLLVDDIVFTCDSINRERINMNRKHYFLDSIEDQIRKVSFRRNSDLPWTMDSGFADYKYNTKKYTFESFKSKLEAEGLVEYSN